MIGSCFTNQAEATYAPMDGELLTVTYGLSKTKYDTLGLDKMTIRMDYKLLLGILNDSPLPQEDRQQQTVQAEREDSWMGTQNYPHSRNKTLWT